MQRRLEKAKRPTSWQKRLDKALLDVDKNPEQRVRLLQKVAKDSKKVASDLRDAAQEIEEKGFGKGHPLVLDLLFPVGTTARSDLEGLLALRTQVPELLQSVKPPSAEQLTPSSLPQPVDPAKVVSGLVSLATDEAKQRELAEEAKNALRPSPKGLETPRYSVVRSWAAGESSLAGSVELRSYAPFTVARKAMAEAGFNSVEGGGAGFNALASYLFGGNVQQEAMAMTMPVEIETDGAGGASMSFVLPRKNEASPPEPSTADVTIEEVPARLVAVKPFAGIVTDEEVERQKAALLEAIAADGATRPVEEGAVSVLQYNSPFTLPWRRRNELAIVVTEEEAVEAAAAEEEDVEATGEVASEGGEGVVSWYDAGVRL